MPTPHNPPAAVRRALRKLGADIHDARRRRRLPMAVVAERAFTSRSTLQRVEAGDTRHPCRGPAYRIRELEVLPVGCQVPVWITRLSAC